jgi:two-component system, sensor histidine kinase and response regulator
MDDYVSKPVRADELLETVVRWVGSEATVSGTALPTSEPGFDPGALAAQVGDDPEILRRIMDTFLIDGRRQLDAVRDAIERGAPGDAEFPAHALKGAAGNVGARGLEQAVQKIELAAREGRPLPLPDLLREAEVRWADLSEQLRGRQAA